ncbi:MAG: sodium ion-translocating decarboxylase subunit beta [Micropruina sp.]
MDHDGERFLQLGTPAISRLGLLAFLLDTAAGVMFGKLLNVFSKCQFNPLIGAAGISAFPMAARVWCSARPDGRTTPSSC